MRPFLLALVAVLAGCEGTHNLGKRNCLPLKLPAEVTLVSEAGLYRGSTEPNLILYAKPGNPDSAHFLGSKQIKALPSGTALKVTKLTQAWGFDAGLGRISAFGTTADGEAFEYVWGSDTTIGPAPWEPVSTAAKRQVQCAR